MNINIKQHDISDCGAACLASVAAYYRLNLPLSKIRHWAGTDRKGTNAWGLIQAAEKMNMCAKGVKAQPEALAEIPLPAIAHLIIQKKQPHFVVIYKISPGKIKIMDPATGRLTNKKIQSFLEAWSGVLILLSPSADFKAGNKKISNLKRFYFLLYPHRKIITQSVTGAAIFTILGLSTSVYIQKITDYVLLNGNRNLLNLLSISMIIILLFQIIIGSMQYILVLKTGQLIDSKLILGYYRYLLKLPQNFFDNMQTGEIVSRINDAVKIRSFINDTLITSIVNILTLIFAFSLMFVYNWKLALIIIFIIPLYLGTYLLINLLNRKRERIIMVQSAELESQLVESINSIKTIKQLGIEYLMQVKTETRFINLLKSAYKSGLNSVFAGYTTFFLSRIFTIIMLWYGSILVLGQEMTPGQLLSFYALFEYFTGPVAGLTEMNKTLQNASIAADRLFEILDIDSEIDNCAIYTNTIPTGDIKLRDISFSYATSTDVFENFNLTIKKSRITAIVGESGSGKSTIASILQKLYPLNGGSVYIGDIDTAYCDKKIMRKLIGIVPQNPDLFDGTILDNITAGCIKPDINHTIFICKQLGMMEFIEKLPYGLHSLIGENGATLSGGQKQRIAIARALYRSPGIVILDEATSSLDPVAEHYVRETIKKLKTENKTILIIAHRLSSVMYSDKIVCLENGKIAEEGTHNELFSKHGKYYNMWKTQMPIMPESISNDII